MSGDFDDTLNNVIGRAADAAQPQGPAAARIRGRQRTVRKRIIISTVSLVLVVGSGTAAALAASGRPGAPTVTANTPSPVAHPTSAPPSASAAAPPPSESATTTPSSAPSTSAPVSATNTTTGTATSGCASAAGALPGSSITVCPAAAPVGGVVQITIQGCAPVDPSADLPEVAAADLQFLGPQSWLGTGGGGGAHVPFSPPTGSTKATATFTIPATYTGGNETSANYPTLTTTPGTDYTFTTDPAGECNVPFTVLAGS